MRFGVAAARAAAVLAVATVLQAPSGNARLPGDVSPTTPDPVVLSRPTTFGIDYRDLIRADPRLVRVAPFRYRANGDRVRGGYVVLPRWYTRRDDPPLPLVIAIHGRGISMRRNLNYWGALPAFGPFALVDPEGQGRRFASYSWGWPGQIDDLARMPSIAEHAVPGLRIDRRRIFAIGSSMGGQETLLLVARHPHLLAGAAALDSATNMAMRYRDFAALPGGRRLQRLARAEIGGTPVQVPHAYAVRSPITYARRIAFSGVPLHLWWSTRDRIVRDQNEESGALWRAIRRDNPHAPVWRDVGTWPHSKEMHPLARLPGLLVHLGLLAPDRSLAQDAAVVSGVLPPDRQRQGQVRSHAA